MEICTRGGRDDLVLHTFVVKSVNSKRLYMMYVRYHIKTMTQIFSFGHSNWPIHKRLGEPRDLAYTSD